MLTLSVGYAFRKPTSPGRTGMDEVRRFQTFVGPLNRSARPSRALLGSTIVSPIATDAAMMGALLGRSLALKFR